MRGKLLFACVAIIAGTTAPPLVEPAAAYFFDGDELLNHCSVAVPTDEFDPAICLTYIMGAYDAYMFQRQVRNQTRCVPRNIDGGRLRAVVVEYLENHPDTRKMDASALVWNAIIARWPDCGLMITR